MSNSKKEYEKMFRQFTNPYSLRNLASEYIIGGGMEWVKNKFGIEFNLTSAEFDKAFKWIEKYDKKFDKHVSNPQSLLDRNKDNKSVPSQFAMEINPSPISNAHIFIYNIAFLQILQ